MHGNLPRPSRPAINPTVQTDRRLPDTGARSDIQSGAQPDTEDHSWFSNPARDLLGSDPGFVLHILTEKIISESSGHRYARGERGVPGYVIRCLLRGPQGAQWLAAIMDGCEATWWREIQLNVELVAAGEKYLAKVEDIKRKRK